MKITPIITSILVNAFAVVGFISVFFILFMKMVLGDNPKLSCVNDREFDFVSSHYANGEKLELIRYQSRVSEAKSVFVLYKRKDRINGCVLDNKQIAMEVVGERATSGETKKYPEKITVENNAIKISYSDSTKIDHHDLPVIWDVKAKVASVR